MAIKDDALFKMLAGRPDDSLDEAVDGTCSRRASVINNGGWGAQVKYLRSAGFSNEQIYEIAGGLVPETATAVLTLQITFDKTITSAEAIGCSIDRLLENSLSTQNILDECGNPDIGLTYIQPQWISDLKNVALVDDEEFLKCAKAALEIMKTQK